MIQPIKPSVRFFTLISIDTTYSLKDFRRFFFTIELCITQFYLHVIGACYFLINPFASVFAFDMVGTFG